MGHITYNKQFMYVTGSAPEGTQNVWLLWHTF